MALSEAQINALISDIKNNKSPAHLDISGHTIIPQYLIAIAEAFKQNTSTHTLDISANGVNEGVGRKLIEMLQVNHTLKTLYYPTLYLDQSTINKINSLIAYNRSLTTTTTSKAPTTTTTTTTTTTKAAITSSTTTSISEVTRVTPSQSQATAADVTVSTTAENTPPTLLNSSEQPSTTTTIKASPTPLPNEDLSTDDVSADIETTEAPTSSEEPPSPVDDTETTEDFLLPSTRNATFFAPNSTIDRLTPRLNGENNPGNGSAGAGIALGLTTGIVGVVILAIILIVYLKRKYATKNAIAQLEDGDAPGMIANPLHLSPPSAICCETSPQVESTSEQRNDEKPQPAYVKLSNHHVYCHTDDCIEPTSGYVAVTDSGLCETPSRVKPISEQRTYEKPQPAYLIPGRAVRTLFNGPDYQECSSTDTANNGENGHYTYIR